MGAWQRFCFLFLFAIIAIAFVRALRPIWWLRRCERLVHGPEPAPAEALHQCHKARRLARSTRGLAEVALWLTCSGGALGLHAAWTVIATSSGSTPAFMADDSLDALEATALGLCLCALLYGAALLFDIVVNAGSRRLRLTHGDAALPAARAATVARAIAAVRHGRRAVVAIASLLVAAAFIELRSRYTGVLRPGDELRVGLAIFDALYQLWARLAIVFAAVGFLAWFGVLMESVLSRREHVV
jgi:hypothetical protein